jgi:hypothetical protein
MVMGLGLVVATGIVGGCDEKPTAPSSKLSVQLPPQPPRTPEQESRRDRTRRTIESEGIPFNAFLPGMELESEVKLRTPREIAERVVGLTVAAALAQGAPKELLETRLAPLQLRTVLTPEELAFFDEAAPSQRQLAKFSWGIESAVTLLWAIGAEPSPLGRPDHECDVQAIYDLVITNGVSGLEAKARARTRAELLDMVDLTYCYHWAVVDEVQVHNRSAPGGLMPGITYERLRSLNWLMHYMDAEWDDVTTDT